jgi:HAD superfamily hydrolase (TIGR01509 family)
MKDYDAYLFDWDDTLAKGNEMWIDLIRDLLEPHAIHLTDNEMASKILGRWHAGMSELGFSDAEIERMGMEIEEAAKVRYPLINLYPYAADVLAELKRQDKKLALVTASWRDVVDIALSAHKLLDLFDVTVTGDEVDAQKPNPHGIQIALEKFGIAPERAIMHGDSSKDLLAANNAGTASLLYFPPEHEVQHDLAELQACNPTYTIRSWQEMLNQLQ